jgi:hypothetical protein
LVSWMSCNCVPTHPWHQPAATLVNVTRCCLSSGPDDWRKHRPKHVELIRSNKLTYIVASLWLYAWLVHYRTNNRLLLVPTHSQINPLHALPSHCLKCYFNIILPSIPISSRLSL